MLTWPVETFQKQPQPCLRPDARLTFRCPMSDQEVRWAAKDVFNPAAVVKGGRVYLLFRAEDDGAAKGTSRIGLAVSRDGTTFEVMPEPVLYPAEDALRDLEHPQGCEDPRVVEREEGGFVMTYTAFNGTSARLCVAVSDDLTTWTKCGPAFGRAFGGRYRNRWSKAGAVVCRSEGERLVATKIGGVYWMYWGEGTLYAATSRDLIDWTPVEFDGNANKVLRFDGDNHWLSDTFPGTPTTLPVLRPRPGRFDSLLVEPGPPALLTDHGILHIYNGASPTGDVGCYVGAQVCFDACDPTAVLTRSEGALLEPSLPFEKAGQHGDVCFATGLVKFKGKWHLYYGAGDSVIGVATAEIA